jgi:hypothetical protein
MGRRGGQSSMLAPFREGCANYVERAEFKRVSEKRVRRSYST